jgi:hypothetical protein
MSGRIAGFAVVAGFAAVNALSFATSGCASTAIRADEIPDVPIAFVYYDAETARKRSERVEAEVDALTGRDPQARGVARMDDVTDLFQKAFGISAETDGHLMGRLALLHPRTGEFTLVAGARRGAVPQDWSNDHERLLFSQVVHDGQPQIFELEVATGLTRRMTFGRTAHPEGCYGPDGSIVVTSVDTRASRPEARIMLTDAEGSESIALSEPGYAFFPTCAPDGSAVVYTAVSANGSAHWLHIRSPIRSGQPQRLTRGLEASFSADGGWIAFSAKLKRESTIWMIRPDGTARKSLGRAGYDEHRPSLSPDNRFVVYTADTRYHQELYLRRIDGTGNRILLTGADGDRPVW